MGKNDTAPSVPAQTGSNGQLPLAPPLAAGVGDPTQARTRAQRDADAVTEMHRAGESANTKRAYAQAHRYLRAWFELRFGAPLDQSLPLTVDQVKAFITDHVPRVMPGEEVADPRLGLDEPVDFGEHAGTGMSLDQSLVGLGVKRQLGAPALTTVEQRLAVLSALHVAIADRIEHNPCQAASVKHLFSMAQRIAVKHRELGLLPKKQRPATRDLLSAMIDTCKDPTRALDVRDRALLYFAFSSGGRRRSEVSAALMMDLERQRDGSFMYHLASSKSNQEGKQDPSNYKPIAGVAAVALRAWLDFAKISEGPIFRSIRGSKISENPVPASSIRDLVIRRAKLANLGHLSAHSLRAGFVTQLGFDHGDEHVGMLLTGHKSLEQFRGYMRPDHTNSAVSKMMDVTPSKLNGDEMSADVVDVVKLRP